MLSWCLWLVAPFFSKCISDPEICVAKQVPPFLLFLFSYNLGCRLLWYLSEQETRTSEFSKCGNNLMCNCTQVLVNCSLGFFVLIFMFIKQSEISRWKALPWVVTAFAAYFYNCRSVVAIKTSRFWRQNSQCSKLRFNFEVTTVQKPHTSNIWISKSFTLNYLSTAPLLQIWQCNGAYSFSTEIQCCLSNYYWVWLFPSFLPSSFVFFCPVRRLSQQREKITNFFSITVLF